MSDRVERIRRTNGCPDEAVATMKIAQSCDYCKTMVRAAGFVLGTLVLHVGCLGPYIQWMNTELDDEQKENASLRASLNERARQWYGVPNQGGSAGTAGPWYSTNIGYEGTSTAGQWVSTTSVYEGTSVAAPITYSTTAANSSLSTENYSRSTGILFMNTGGFKYMDAFGAVTAYTPESDLGP